MSEVCERLTPPRSPPRLPIPNRVKVDVGSLDGSVVEDAIRVAGAGRAGLTSLTKAVRAAASCISV